MGPGAVLSLKGHEMETHQCPNPFVRTPLLSSRAVGGGGLCTTTLFKTWMAKHCKGPWICATKMHTGGAKGRKDMAASKIGLLEQSRGDVRPSHAAKAPLCA